MPNNTTKFISNWERRIRIEAVLKTKKWSWYRLAQEMNRSVSSVERALRVQKNSKTTCYVEMVKACAKALGVSGGFLIDRFYAAKFNDEEQ